MDEAELREVSGAEFARSLDAVVTVYAAAMGAPAAELPGRRAIIRSHISYPGYRALRAEVNGVIVGFAYGFHSRRGQWWHDVVREALVATCGSRQARRWLADCFEIGEVHVLPDNQGRGIGFRLVTALCTDRPERTALLSTPDTESRARRLYRRLGFVDLLREFQFPGAPLRYAVMGATLPLRPRVASPSRA